MAGLLATPKVIEVVRKMSDGGTYQVTNCPYVARRISGSTLSRLRKLGWVEVDRQWASGGTYRTYIRLNESGMTRAEEFALLSEANAVN